MIKAFLGNNNCKFLCFLWLIASFGFVHAQEQKATPDIEKVYLHTDRTRYFIGDDLWYKAYNVRATNNVLYDNSNLLYVELVAPDSKIIARNKTNIELGLGYGDFQLSDSLGVIPGVYQLRAYTNWDRNFGDDFVFKKEIEIMDPFEMHNRPNKVLPPVLGPKTRKPITAKSASTVNEKEISIDFFPEGGSLLDNVASIVGFKAVDAKGIPIDVSGEIYDSDNQLVTSFASVHDGMGKLQMMPNEGKKYHAKGKTATGLEFKKDLPLATKSGYVIGFRLFKGKNIVTISTNDATLAQNPNAALTVVCKSRGITYLESQLTLTATTLSFELTKDRASEGISEITLLDSKNIPQSQRLVYIEKDQDLDVQVITDKATYQPNEKSTINIISKSKEGNPKSASYSISVTDMDGIVEDKEYGTTISSYFLMESDIRGKVFHPAYYFDASNPKRLDHLDNLLLTQGWRYFVWKSLPAPKSNFKVEKGITISGRVKQVFADKPLENSYVSLSLLNKKRRNFFSLKPDAATGNFKFENMMFSGKTNMFLNSVNEKGKFRGEIVLDTIEQEPMSVNYRDEEVNWSETSRLVAENVFRKYAAFGVQPENILNEVSIVSKKENALRSMFGIPENSYTADADAKTFTNIYELIAQKIPGVMLDGDSIRFLRSNSTPLYVLNGFEVTKEEIDVIQPQDVEKIDVIRGIQATMFFGESAENGFIAIYTNPNAPKRVKEKNYAIQKEIEGYYISRVFYSPTPEQMQLDLDNKLSVRNTLYWNAYVHPDKTGNASVNYYNTKVETKVKVALEGMTAAGIPVVKNLYYSIKK